MIRRAAVLLCLLFSSLADDEDVLCLRGLKVSLDDPRRRLHWNFDNATVAFICEFAGVKCEDSSNKTVIGLRLPSMSLAGTLPPAIRFCHYATSLNLSGNSLFGTIPRDFCYWLPFLTDLDLSGNNFSGPIPAEISNCHFLFSLDLADNAFSGPIPASLSRLSNLKRLNVSGNRLSGEIPQSIASSFVSPSVFQSNAGLCGRPLSSRCGSDSINRGELIVLIAIGVFGVAASLLIVYAVWLFCVFRDSKRAKSGDF